MYKVMVMTVIFGLSIGVGNAAKWTNGSGQGQAKIKKQSEVWSRLTNDEVCDKLKTLNKSTSIWRKLDAEREKRVLRCK